MRNRQGSRTSAWAPAGAPTPSATAQGGGVALSAPATEGAVRMAAALASGVAESLNMGLEAAASLNAIAVEGARNVVAHAYPPGEVGPLWMRIEPAAAIKTDQREIAVSFRDAGRGCSIWPTADDPQGLGLALICELSERTQITSRRGGGTELEASVALEDDVFIADATGEPPYRPWDSEISFDGTEMMGPILPRVLGASVEVPGATVDQIVEASRLGEALAADLAMLDDAAVHAISVTERPEDSAAPLQVRVGPLERIDAEQLIRGLEASWDGRPGAIHLATEMNGTDRAVTLIELDLPHR